MEQPEANAVLLAEIDEANFSAVKLPTGRDISTILVAVRIAEHHFLQSPAAINQAAICRDRQQTIHDLDAVSQILDRLEQRDDVDVAFALSANEPHFAQQ